MYNCIVCNNIVYYYITCCYHDIILSLVTKYIFCDVITVVAEARRPPVCRDSAAAIAFSVIICLRRYRLRGLTRGGDRRAVPIIFRWRSVTSVFATPALYRIGGHYRSLFRLLSNAIRLFPRTMSTIVCLRYVLVVDHRN